MAYDDKILKKMTSKELFYFLLMHNPDKNGVFQIGELEDRIELASDEYPKLKELTKKYKSQTTHKLTDDLQTIITNGVQKGELQRDPNEKNKAYLSPKTLRFFKQNLEREYGPHIHSMYKELIKTVWTDY